MSEIFRLVLLFGLPWAISKGLSLLRNRNSTRLEPTATVTTPLKLTRSESILKMMIILIASLFLYRAYRIRSPNFFKLLDVPVEAPSYAFRNIANIHFNNWKESDPALKAVAESRHKILDAAQSGSSHPWNHLVTDNPKLEYEIAKFERLADALRLSELRNRYSKFGESAFLGCTLACRDDHDYFMYRLPTLIMHFATFLFSIGLLTSLASKEKWRLIAVLISTVSVAYELYIYYLQVGTELFVYNFIFPIDPTLLLHQKLDRLRDLVFGLFLIIAVLIDWPVAESRLILLLNRVLSISENTVGRLHLIRLVRAVVMRDTDLRKRFFDHNKNAELLKGGALDSPAFVAKNTNVIQKYNIEAMVNEASAAIDKSLVDSAK